MRSVRWEQSALANLRRLRQIDPDVARSVGAAVDRFAQTGEGNVTKLGGAPDLWRLSVGRWRIAFTEDEGVIVVLGVLWGREPSES